MVFLILLDSRAIQEVQDSEYTRWTYALAPRRADPTSRQLPAACTRKAAAAAVRTAYGFPATRVVQRVFPACRVVKAWTSCRDASFHEPAVAHDQGLTRQRIGREGREKQRGLRNVVDGRELAIDCFLEHDILDDVRL